MGFGDAEVGEKKLTILHHGICSCTYQRLELRNPRDTPP